MFGIELTPYLMAAERATSLRGVRIVSNTSTDSTLTISMYWIVLAIQFSGIISGDVGLARHALLI